MEFTIEQLSGILGGTIEGDKSLKVRNLGKIEEAKEGDVSFLSNPKYENFIYTTNATAVIVSKDLFQKKLVKQRL